MQNFVRVYEIIADIDLVESFLTGAFLGSGRLPWENSEMSVELTRTALGRSFGPKCEEEAKVVENEPPECHVRTSFKDPGHLAWSDAESGVEINPGRLDGLE